MQYLKFPSLPTHEWSCAIRSITALRCLTQSKDVLDYRYLARLESVRLAVFTAVDCLVYGATGVIELAVAAVEIPACLIWKQRSPKMTAIDAGHRLARAAKLAIAIFPGFIACLISPTYTIDRYQHFSLIPKANAPADAAAWLAAYRRRFATVAGIAALVLPIAGRYFGFFGNPGNVAVAASLPSQGGIVALAAAAILTIRAYRNRTQASAKNAVALEPYISTSTFKEFMQSEVKRFEDGDVVAVDIGGPTEYVTCYGTIGTFEQRGHFEKLWIFRGPTHSAPGAKRPPVDPRFRCTKLLNNRSVRHSMVDIRVWDRNQNKIESHQGLFYNMGELFQLKVDQDNTRLFTSTHVVEIKLAQPQSADGASAAWSSASSTPSKHFVTKKPQVPAYTVSEHMVRQLVNKSGVKWGTRVDNGFKEGDLIEVRVKESMTYRAYGYLEKGEDPQRSDDLAFKCLGKGVRAEETEEDCPVSSKKIMNLKELNREVLFTTTQNLDENEPNTVYTIRGRITGFYDGNAIAVTVDGEPKYTRPYRFESITDFQIVQ